MTDREAARQALLAKYGQPMRVDAGTALNVLGKPEGFYPDEVVAFRYPSREAAEEWHQLNADHHGHESVGIVPAEPNSTQVIGVMSIKAKLAEMQGRSFREQRAR